MRERRLYLASAAMAGLVLVSGAPAHAEPVTGASITIVCPYTGPGIAACVSAGVVLHELVQIGNGKRGFGPNGEVMKVLAAPVKIVGGNIKGSEREHGVIAKVLRVGGISVKDIKHYGIWGGHNSFFRKPFG